MNLRELPWSKPRKVPTKRGYRILRTWNIPNGHGFWHYWRTGEPKRLGYSIRKLDNGVWQLAEWTKPNGEAPEPYVEINVGSGEAKLSGLTLTRFKEIEHKLLEWQRPHTKRLIAALLSFLGAL